MIIYLRERKREKLCLMYIFINLQAWDFGLFLTIKEVYSTGYVVSALAVISALALAAM